MILPRRYFFFLVITLAGACAEKRRPDLPRALTPAEINEYFPRSEPLAVSPLEIVMQQHGLLDLQEIDPEIRVDLKYSSRDNFVGEDLYGTLELAYLQPEPARALAEASRLLQRDNPYLRLLLYDAARPLKVQEMLWQKGVNWNDYPAHFKRGTYIQRRKTVRKFTTEELEKLPEKHEARRNPDLMVERTDYFPLELPPLAKVYNRARVLFLGHPPEVLGED